ncbi:MAG: DUF3048 domain-containing protein [Patescibacteria group bacterium]
MNKKITYLISLVIVYLIGLGIGYLAFPKVSAETLVSPALEGGGAKAGKPLVVINPSEPKNQTCPLNGLAYTTTEKNLWEKRRPMTVMIENHQEARPQSGLSSADIVYEAVAEGAITRLLAVFYCDIAATDLTIGPVRSARTYFLDWASEYGKYPIYVHVGGANTPNKANALGQIRDYGWQGVNDLNQFGLGVKECWRDDTILKKANNIDRVATEHTMYCSTENLYKAAQKRGITNLDKKGDSWTKSYVPWKFGDKPDSGTGKLATSVDLDFWKDYGEYHVTWTYDNNTKTYKRANGGQVHKDNNIGNQLEAGTVIVQFVTETGPIDDEKHMLYGTIGSGNTLVFSEGQVFSATWSKKSRLDRTIYKDSRGKEFQFVPGKIWVEILSKANNSVSYQ